MAYPERMSTLGWVVSIAVVVLLVALILALVVWALEGRRLPEPPEPTQRTPHEVIAHRYAAGEIDEHEYRRVRDVLAEKPQLPAVADRGESLGHGAD